MADIVASWGAAGSAPTVGLAGQRGSQRKHKTRSDAMTLE